MINPTEAVQRYRKEIRERIMKRYNLKSEHDITYEMYEKEMEGE
jgi:hypothetical protein